MKDSFLRELEHNKTKKRNIYITVEAMEDNSEGRIICKSEQSKSNVPQPKQMPRKTRSVQPV